MRRLLRLSLLAFLLWLAYLNYQLYYQPHFAPEAGRPLNQDLLAQLRFLKKSRHQGAAEDMQQLYPEGFVYFHALYALSWLELAGGLPAEAVLRREALAEAAHSIQAINSPAGKAQFQAGLLIPYGAYYQGWSTYVLGRYLATQSADTRTPADTKLFQQKCAQIAYGLRAHPSPYPESYSGAAWPADGVMCVAALAWHDRILPPRYRPTIQQWLKLVDTRLDSLRLIPHSSQPESGQALEAARGSSQSQLLNFLVEIDSVYAQQHFARYRTYFLTSRLGLPGVREAATGAANVTDIDSGPVLWGVGGAASIVGRRTFQRFGDTATATGLRNSIEAFGMPLQSTGTKRYMFGLLPIADAFIAWSNSLEVNRAADGSSGWRSYFQGLSALLGLGLLAALRMLKRWPVNSSKIPN